MLCQADAELKEHQNALLLRVLFDIYVADNQFCFISEWVLLLGDGGSGKGGGKKGDFMPIKAQLKIRLKLI